MLYTSMYITGKQAQSYVRFFPIVELTFISRMVFDRLAFGEGDATFAISTAQNSYASARLQRER